VDHALPEDAAIAIRGPGTVAEHLARIVREQDHHRRRERLVEVRREAPMTRPQMIAAVKDLAGDAPKRRMPGKRPSSPRAATTPRFVPDIEQESEEPEEA
jgi:hypothetical protein